MSEPEILTAEQAKAVSGNRREDFWVYLRLKDAEAIVKSHEALRAALVTRDEELDARAQQVQIIVDNGKAAIALLQRKLEEAESALVTRTEERDSVRHFVENWSAVRWLEDCTPYLKDGETPAECIQRHRKDIDALLTLLAQEKTRAEQAEADRDARFTREEIEQAWTDEVLEAAALDGRSFSRGTARLPEMRARLLSALPTRGR